MPKHTKVKIITGFSELETEVQANQWLEDNPEINIIDMKYSLAVINYHNRDKVNIHVNHTVAFSILIHYQQET